MQKNKISIILKLKSFEIAKLKNSNNSTENSEIEKFKNLNFIRSKNTDNSHWIIHKECKG